MPFVKFRGEDKVVSKFNKLLDRKVTAFLAAGGFDEKLERGFEGDIAAQQFKPLSPKYIRWKVKRGYSPQAWVMTGKLERSLRSNTITKVGYNKGVTYEFTSKGMAIVYPTALFKRLGSDQGKAYGKYGKMNRARPLFVWNQNDMAGIERGVAKRFQRFLQGEGFVVKVRGRAI
jgi:hypothetical protein